jgi:hypothetical protein
LRVNRVLIRDEQGEVTGILERGRALNSHGGDTPDEAPLRLMVEQMPGLLWTTDQNLRITSNWGKGLTSLNILPGAFVGRHLREFLECAAPQTTPIAEHHEALRGVSTQFEYKWKCRSLEIRLEPNEHCRSTDLAVRYGGDEFAVVLIDSDKGMAEQVAQRIETGLRSDPNEPPLSVSIGIGVYPYDGRTVAELIEAADRQLYKCKRAENRRTLPAAGRILHSKRAGR